MYVSRTKFNYKITKTTAIITGTLSVNSRNKMLKSQCASKCEIYIKIPIIKYIVYVLYKIKISQNTLDRNTPYWSCKEYKKLTCWVEVTTIKDWHTNSIYSFQANWSCQTVIWSWPPIIIKTYTNVRFKNVKTLVPHQRHHRLGKSSKWC
jgi:hypothetical protein